MEYLEHVKAVVDKYIPKEAQVTNVDIEGPEIVIYTKNPAIFFENEKYIAEVAAELKKRIKTRTDKSLQKDPAFVKQKILEIVPKDADIKNIEFESSFSQVIIEAFKPGLVIGKGGETLKQITLTTGWTPKIERAPISESEILKGIRHHLHKYSNERKKILYALANKIYGNVVTQNGWIRVTALGGFREVGRSCMMIETKDSRVLLDCGINVASNEEPYPYLDALRFPVNEIDAVVISHAHLDHSGFVPYLFKLGYRGPVYCTEPTRDLMALLQFDYIDVLIKDDKEPPYTERDVKEMVKYCITREYREVTDITPDIRITFHNAAHILGSASVHLHIGQGAHNVIYTGDFKYGFTRLFDNLDTKYPRLETLIIESTYGGSNDIQPNRQQSEEYLLKVIKETLEQGGNVLIPVFAVGRAQEIMLVLESFYKKGLLPEGTKCYIDGMTKEASIIHTAYPEYLRQNVRTRILHNDSPFSSELFHETRSNDRDVIVNEKGAIILASSGMLTGGVSVRYLYAMAEDPRNTLIFVGWQGEGSLGRKIQGGLRSIPIVENGKTREMKINMRVESCEGFSGHSDRNQLVSYIKAIKPAPKRIVVNHGENQNCVDFARYLTNRFKVSSYALKNLDALRLK
ncbi:MAG: beta-CASP ribonuclease aCPSF1 [Candidatus Diapherotrites archaeon]|nr:beta-CASP ribonuclease aCPSF1 [Candidatus Diapherotrites archaeon]